MPAEVVSLATFNRGRVDARALARVDLKRVALAAETQTNWIPRAAGSMSIRPGLEYIGTTKDNLKAKHIPFVFSTSDTAIIEITNGGTRVLRSEAPISRTGVSSAVANGTFSSSLDSWTSADEAGRSEEHTSELQS